VRSVNHDNSPSRVYREQIRRFQDALRLAGMQDGRSDHCARSAGDTCPPRSRL